MRITRPIHISTPANFYHNRGFKSIDNGKKSVSGEEKRGHWGLIIGEKIEVESRQEKPWKRGNTGMYIDICVKS
jgi:hypothetical protein